MICQTDFPSAPASACHRNYGTPPMPAQIHLFLCFNDNYGVLIHDPATGRVGHNFTDRDYPAVMAGLRRARSWARAHRRCPRLLR